MMNKWVKKVNNSKIFKFWFLLDPNEEIELYEEPIFEKESEKSKLFEDKFWYF